MALFDSDPADSGIDRIRHSLEEADRVHARAVKAAWITILSLVIVVTLFAAPSMLRALRESGRVVTRAPSAAAAGLVAAERPATPEATSQVEPSEARPASATGPKAEVAAAPVSPRAARSAQAPTRSAAPSAPPKRTTPGAPRASAPKPKRQRLAIAIGRIGYEPSTLRAKTGAPITLVVGKGEGCAAGFLMPALGVNFDNSRGSVSIDLGVLRPGTYTFTCGMSMLEGRLIVRS